ncbi:unnamed protein product [Diamesa tonsa]
MLSSTKNIVQNAVSRSMYQRYKLINARQISTSTINREKLAFKIKPEVKTSTFERALLDAESIVGYQSSAMSLRYLINDDMTNLTPYVKSFLKSGHPLIKTCKEMICGKTNSQLWGLIVLMMSKIAGISPTLPESRREETGGILDSQRILAESLEMSRTAFLIHDGLINLQSLPNAGNDLNGDSELILGNKVAILGGDYLQGLAAAKVAKLKHYELFELISSAGRDINDGHFIGDRDDQNYPLPSDPTLRVVYENEEPTNDQIDNLQPFNIKSALGKPESEWELRHFLIDGSMLSKSCQGALMLAGFEKDIQKNAYNLGKHWSLAWQAFMDLEPFKMNELPTNTHLNLVSAPVLFHLDHDPTLYEEIKKGLDSVDDIDYQLLHREIMKGPGLEKTRELQGKHSLKAMTELYKFPQSECRQAMENIILAMQED